MKRCYGPLLSFGLELLKQFFKRNKYHGILYGCCSLLLQRRTPRNVPTWTELINKSDWGVVRAFVYIPIPLSCSKLSPECWNSSARASRQTGKGESVPPNRALTKSLQQAGGEGRKPHYYSPGSAARPGRT